MRHTTARDTLELLAILAVMTAIGAIGIGIFGIR
jgi:hypothetical protein